MSVGTAASSSIPLESLESFLKERKKEPFSNIVIGNEAGDADSIISAIALAYTDSFTPIKGDQEGDVSKIRNLKKPIVSIPKTDLKTQRPETTLLLQLAGISLDDLSYVDDLIPLTGDGDDDNESASVDVTLVDHNRLAGKFLPITKFSVVEIVDHHTDEGKHTETCSNSDKHGMDQCRNVAFSDGKALVASTCTLVVERWNDTVRLSYPVPLAIMLLGVILLDSVNMSSQAGKGTPRDAAAIQNLMEDTDWSSSLQQSKDILKIKGSESGAIRPDPTAFFDALQAAKFDIQFWRSLSVRDAARLDYKAFTYTSNSDNHKKGAGVFGISSILMSFHDFKADKSDLEGDLGRYMKEVGVEFLALMFSFVREDGSHVRQLVLCGAPSFPLQAVINFVLKAEHDHESLQLKEMKDCDFDVATATTDLTIRCFDQINSRASRKQVAPILRQFFETPI